MTPEGKVKQEVKDYLKSLGPDCWYYCPVPMGYGKRGVPDFLICYKGVFLAPETKRRGGKSEPWQEREQAAIRTAGGKCDWISDVALIRQWVAWVDQLIITYPATV